jgi:hypothetical protein
LGTGHADISQVKGIFVCGVYQPGINMGYLMVSLVIEMYIFYHMLCFSLAELLLFNLCTALEVT